MKPSYLDIIFMMIYLFEFILKVIASRWEYFSSNYNRFDCFILLITVLEFMQEALNVQIVNNVAVLRVFRASRAMRALRSISFVRSLQIIVTALIKTVLSIGNLILLLLILMYVFAIMGFYFLGQDDGDVDNWGDVPTGMFTLWVLVTADGWTQFQNVLDSKGMPASRLFTSTFVFIGNFIFTNLFIGIVIQNLEEAQTEEQTYQNNQRNSLITRKKCNLKKKQEKEIHALFVTQAKKKPKQSTIQSNLQKAFEALQSTLRSDDLRIMNHPLCHPLWIEAYLNTLQFEDNCLYRSQQLSFEISNTFARIFEENMALEMERTVDEVLRPDKEAFHKLHMDHDNDGSRSPLPIAANKDPATPKKRRAQPRPLLRHASANTPKKDSFKNTIDK